MKESPINLDKSVLGHQAKKFTCPACNKKRFVKFYDSSKDEYLGDEYGRCDREEECGYFLSPFADIAASSGSPRKNYDYEFKVTEPTAFVDKSIVAKTLDHYELNNLFLFIEQMIGTEAATAVFLKFYVGTAKRNGTIFWQIDQDMKVRTGQKIHYGLNGKRLKDGDPELTGATRLYQVKNGYQPCLFGLHQLRKAPKNAVIAIVESEKTALIASIFMPQLTNGTPLVWMASSGSNGLTDDKIFPIRNRSVALVPDYSFHARATWGLVLMRKKKIEKIIKGEPKMISVAAEDGDLQPDFISGKARLEKFGCNVKFIDLHPDRDDGGDIADHLIEEREKVNYFSMPDFGSFKLPQPAENRGPANLQVETFSTDGADLAAIGRALWDEPKPQAKDPVKELIETNATICTIELRDGRIAAYRIGVDGIAYWQTIPHPKLKLPSKEQFNYIISNPLVQQLMGKFDASPDERLYSNLK